ALPVLVAPLDPDEAGTGLRQRLLADGVDVRPIPCSRPLPEKQRFLVGSQKVMKIDLVERLEPDAAKQDEFLAAFTEAVTDGGGGGADATVIADFGLGLFSQSLMPRVCAAARAHSAVVSGDVSGRRSNLLHMRNLDLVCPSES